MHSGVRNILLIRKRRGGESHCTHSGDFALTSVAHEWNEVVCTPEERSKRARGPLPRGRGVLFSCFSALLVATAKTATCFPVSLLHQLALSAESRRVWEKVRDFGSMADRVCCDLSEATHLAAIYGQHTPHRR